MCYQQRASKINDTSVATSISSTNLLGYNISPFKTPRLFGEREDLLTGANYVEDEPGVSSITRKQRNAKEERKGDKERGRKGGRKEKKAKTEEKEKKRKRIKKTAMMKEFQWPTWDNLTI